MFMLSDLVVETGSIVGPAAEAKTEIGRRNTGVHVPGTRGN